MAPRRDRPATAARRRQWWWKTTFLVACALAPVASGLRSVANSPCADVCSDDTAGTLEDAVTCLDENFGRTTTGANFEKCISCELNSTAVEQGSNETDVEWGLCEHIIRGDDVFACLWRLMLRSQPSVYTLGMHVRVPSRGRLDQ